MSQFIVAEVSKNWRDGEEAVPSFGLICQNFENIIEVNRQLGYKLHSFTLHRLMQDPHTMNETIIAVFERMPSLGNAEESIDALRKAGGDAWDKIEDPEEYLGRRESSPCHWLEFTQGGSKSKEKVRLRADTILGVRPCGSASYGTNIDVSLPIGLVAVEESPEEVWKALKGEQSP